VNGAGHTFSPPAAQDTLREHLVDFIVHQAGHDSAVVQSGPEFSESLANRLEQAVER
jgi:hypothetical protein